MNIKLKNNNKKKICFIAQFPPPMHGLSKAVETLYNSNLNKEFEFEKINITDNKRFFKNLINIFISKSDLFYFTISQTKGGNVRDLLILKLLNLQKKKCLIHLHGGYYRKLIDNDMGFLQKSLNYKAIKGLDGVIVLSKSLTNIFKGMIDSEKIFVVPNCVDNQFLISEEEFEKKMQMVERKEILHVLYLSNFIETKGYREVLKLAKLEKERCRKGEIKKLHFDFAGRFFEDTEKKYFFSYIQKNGLQDYVTYHGIIGGEEKKQLLKNSHIFILLTKYPNEGQPISILEAMGNGMFIVTTDHAGIPDTVKNGVNGLVVITSFTNEIILQIFNKVTKINKRRVVQVMRNNRNICISSYRENTYIKNMYKAFRLCTFN